MHALAKAQTNDTRQWAQHEVSWAELRAALADHRTRRLSFAYAGRLTRRGFHVTEVKAGQFASLDCGANPEAWAETFIQVWDVEEDSARGPLTVGTFVAIMDKVGRAVSLDDDSRLTFEVSDGVTPMQLFRADGMSIDGDTVTMALAPRASSCKPRDRRWLEQRGGQAQRCCAA